MPKITQLKMVELAFIHWLYKKDMQKKLLELVLLPVHPKLYETVVVWVQWQVSTSANDLGPVIFVVMNSNSLDFLVCVCACVWFLLFLDL